MNMKKKLKAVAVLSVVASTAINLTVRDKFTGPLAQEKYDMLLSVTGLAIGVAVQLAYRKEGK